LFYWSFTHDLWDNKKHSDTDGTRLEGEKIGLLWHDYMQQYI